MIGESVSGGQLDFDWVKSDRRKFRKLSKIEKWVCNLKKVFKNPPEEKGRSES